MECVEKKIKGGTIVGVVAEPKPVEEVKPEAEQEAPKKRTRKAKEE